MHENDRSINTNQYRGTLVLDKIRVANRRNYHFSILLASNISATETVYDFPKKPKTITFNELPPKFKEEYERQLHSFRAMRVGEDNGNTRRVIPPLP